MQDQRQASQFPSEPVVASAEKLPLCVDFDGTLIRTDSLYECFVVAARLYPLQLLVLLPLMFRSRAGFKAALWRLVAKDVSVSLFPREPAVVELVERAKAEGRQVDLVSAADGHLLRSDPSLVAMFDNVVGSDGAHNLKGPAKAQALAERHPDGFAYVGDSSADIPVFAAAKRGYGVRLSSQAESAIRSEGHPVERLIPRESRVPALLRAMRLHQWFKNILIFVPAGLALDALYPAEVARVAFGFVLLGVLASATYIINDLFDLNSDRAHPRKSKRPLASGVLPLPWAVISAPLMIVAALVLAFFIEPRFGGVLLAYLVTTLAYSFRLKQTPVVDVLVIGFLFALRVVAGMTLVSQHASQWLLIFSVFFFTGLAFMKRDAEIATLIERSQHALKGRGYTVQDRPFVQIAGISTSIASLVIFSLFIVAVFEGGSQYSSPYFLWVAYFVLAYWMLRLWFMTARGHMHDDPIVYAIKDRKSLFLFLVIGLFAALAQIV